VNILSFLEPEQRPRASDIEGTKLLIGEGSHEAAFASVCEALRNEDFVCPKCVGEFGSGLVRSGAFILPDNAGAGMMETLCLRTVESDPGLECVDAFFGCVQQKAQRSPDPNKLEKARAHAYLASMPIPDKNPGLAALEGYWDMDSSALDSLKHFIDTLSGL